MLQITAHYIILNIKNLLGFQAEPIIISWTFKEPDLSNSICINWLSIWNSIIAHK